MSNSSNNTILVPKEEMVAAQKELTITWGPAQKRRWQQRQRLYLSYGMIAMKGICPALTDTVEAAPSFTVLSPPLGLDFFGVLDGRRGLGADAADGEAERLLAQLRDAISQQVYSELLTNSPRFLDGTSRFGWWVTTLREAFRAFHDEVPAVAAGSQGVQGMDAPAAATATAIVALVLKKYVVIGNYGTSSKAVLSRDGELVELSCDFLNMVATDASVSSAPAPAPARAATGVVDVVVVERHARDEFLILASAALWDKVTPAAACAHVRRRLGRTLGDTTPPETRITDAEGSPTLLAEELARKALQAGSQDNVSVGLILFTDFWHARNQRTRRPNSMVFGPMWQN